MPKSRRCCIFVLILGGMHLVTGCVSISGCSGESATLYRDISFNSDNIVVFNLYKNGDNYTLLAMWSKQKSDPVKESYENGYGKRLSLENGTILIHNLSKSDEGKYVLQHALGTSSRKTEVDLVVLVAPPKQCTPNIKRVKNNLIASLDEEDCGNPAAHVSWYKFCASNRSRPVCKLNNTWELKGKTESMINFGKEADTYCACAESSAMHCVRRFDRFDLCSCFKIEKDDKLLRRRKMTTSSELSESTKKTTDIHVESLKLPDWIKGSLSITSILAFVQVIAILIILYRCCKVSPPSGNRECSEQNVELMTTRMDSEVSPPSGNPQLSEENGTLMTTRMDSEVSPPSGNPQLSETNGTLMTTRMDSEVSPPSGNPQLSEENGTLMTTRMDSEVSPPSGNPELSEESGTLMTTRMDPEVSPPSGNPELSEEDGTLMTTRMDPEGEMEKTGFVCSESNTKGLKSQGLCIRIPRSATKRSSVQIKYQRVSDDLNETI